VSQIDEPAPQLQQELVLKRFGSRVRAIRTQRGLSQEGLAYRSGLDRSYMGGVERGERNLSVWNICRIANALDIPPGELMPDLAEIRATPPTKS
jgi:transcriptional regulator with XRE-family HTH domain